MRLLWQIQEVCAMSSLMEESPAFSSQKVKLGRTGGTNPTDGREGSGVCVLGNGGSGLCG